MVQANTLLLTHRLHYFTLRVAYYHALWAGFLPALYNWHTGKLNTSRFYLLYSAGIQLCFALGTPYIYKGYLERSAERFDDKVIQWTDIMTNAGRYLTFTALCLYIWTRRQNMIKLWEELWHLDSLYARILPAVEGHVSMRTRWLTIYYFWSTHIITPLTSLYVLLQFPRQTNEHIIMTSVSWAQSTFQVMLAYYTLVIHCHFIQKYQAINGELISVLTALVSLPCGHNNETRVGRVRLRMLTQRLSLLVAANFEYLRFTLRVFRFGQLTFLLILIKCFIVNINALHTCVWHIFHLSSLYSLIAFLLMVVLYANLVANIIGVPWLLSSCNESAKIMRKASKLIELRCDRQLMQVLDNFSVYLCCNRLRYTICGLFELDLPQCVTFFFVVLVQVTVLIQFDMEREIGNQ